jgi:acetyl/propionyl-CoA carboxylase alpha subunit
MKKLAIANRGEVAVRIIHACHELGIRTVLLHSEADIGTRAFRMTDEAVCLGAASLSETYLNIEANIRGALSVKAEAIHPGFGFLSENADFAEACVKAGLIFIGPKAESIRLLGDKISAKKIISEAGVPFVPGYMGEKQDLAHLVIEAQSIGYPVIVKAAAGGGGRGMKILRNDDDAQELIPSAQREALSAFGSSTVFLEKYLDHAKHIEFQIFGDLKGNCVHLFERECTVQRRHQKIIEEASAMNLSESLRSQMSQAAVTLAKKAKYQGAGTVEFLVQDGKFYFLEMNTRLQVEHPVTEMILGIDLVKAQILNSSGQFELWKQTDLKPRGHAIEARIYAENPFENGIPSTGRIAAQHFAEAPGRRFELGFEAGDVITPYYDSMIAKIIVWDESRPRAIQKMLQTLDESFVFGVHVNFEYLKAILRHPEFIAGTMTTQFISKYFPEGLMARELSKTEESFAAKAFHHLSKPKTQIETSPWQTDWRLV